MSDNVELNPGTGGAIAATDDVGGVHYQKIKLDLGGDGVSTPVVGTMPVSGTVAVSNMVAQGLTDAQLRATAVPVSGTFWQATQPVSGPLTDTELRLTPLTTALQAVGAEYWPGYSGSPDTSLQDLTVDPSGALITRGAVTTDEGTFRINFSNTSLAVGIGSVTVAGDVVTGTGFLAADVHYKDYFKLDADGESAWTGIASVDSDTQITLRAAYVGGASGAASRALVRPVTGAGGSITIGSGKATLTTGTTINSITRLVRDMDFAPLVNRLRISISQRIVNQSFRIGLSEAFTTTDRWFARFLVDGTVNTTVKCETGRNPTGAPSAAETETTTVTIPNGLTTAALLDYRVEQLTESVRFYINGVLVAEHTRAIPAQHDEMESAIGCFNGGSAPATSTTVVVDYLTGKNHNKLEIGIMSDAERIVAAAVPLQQFTYGPTAGVITINTDLMVLDCSQIRSLFIQCNSMGTTGVVTVAWSNTPDFAQPITATLMSESGATSTTFNAAVLRVTNVLARYCRLRLTTATTAGTTTLNVWGAQTTYTPIVTTQPVSGTVTANIGTGSLAAGVNRVAFVAGAGIWFDDSSTVLAGAATFTGTSRDLTVTATATAMANAATYVKEMRVSAESDQSGTLWVEFSRDNTNWRRAKSAATAAVTGGGQFAEIIFRPSWRYARVGFTNGATLQTRFSIGSILIAG